MIKRLLLISLLLFASPVLAGDNNVGSIVGTIDVGEKGEVTYTIPIETIPTAVGINPKVSLAFHSGLGRVSGAAGWFIQPVEKIDKCFRNDRAKRLDTDLTYCLNGQEMVLTNGVYGANNSQYRNRVDNLDRITKRSDGFVVEKKNGDRQFYIGQTIENTDGETVTWLLSRLEDRHGNYVTYHYHGDESSQRFLKKISYGGNEAAELEHYRHVEIEYDAVDALPSYRFGTNQANNAIPKTITVLSFDKTVWRYNLQWDETDSGVHVLSSIQKCSSASNCLPATKFTYVGATSNPLFEAKSMGNMFTMDEFPWSSTKDLRLTTDLDYDGYPDLIGVRASQIHLSYGCRQGFSPRTMISHSGLSSWERKYPVQIADIDRDGFADILAFHKNGFNFIRGKPNGFFQEFESSDAIIGVARNDAKRELTDFDHDGDLDIIAVEKDGTYLLVFEEQTGGFAVKRKITGGFKRLNWQADWPIYFADMNGDDFKDFIGISKTDVLVALRTAEGFSEPKSWSRSPVLLFSGSAKFSHGLSDLNKDGLADIFVVNNSGLHAALNNGSSFNSPVVWNKRINASSFNSQNSVITTSDANNDGRIDFIASRLNKIHVLYGTGQVNVEAETVQFTPGYAAVNPELHRVFVSDLDNDTVTDVLVLHQRELFAVRNGDQPIYLETIEDGLKNRIKIDWDMGNQKNTVEIQPFRFDKKRFQIFNNNFTTVRQLTTTGPSGYQETLEYRYKNPLVSKKEVYRFAGFSKKVEISTGKNITHVTDYVHLVDDLEMLFPERKQTFVNWKGDQVLINRIRHEWKVRDLGGFYQVLNPSVEELSLDETGVELSEKKTTKQFDEFLNLTESRVEIKDKHGIYVVDTLNEFDNDLENWICNKLIGARVTYRRGDHSEIKHSAFTYENGVLQSEITEPGTPFEKKVTYIRNSLGLPIKEEIKISDANGLPGDVFASTIEYDQFGFIKATINALGHQTKFETNKIFGRPQKITDPNGLWVENVFDSWGDIQKTNHKDGRFEIVERFWRHQNSPPQAAYFVLNKATGSADSIVFYDSQSRVVRESVKGFGGRWIHVDTSYTDAGLVQRESNPYFEDQQPVFTIYDYDELQRLTTQTRADSSISKVVYDGLNRIEIDALGRHRTIVLNALDEKIGIRFEDASKIKFNYTASGKLKSSQDVKGNITLMEYDVLGRRVKITEPTTGVTQTFYNGLDLKYKTIANDGTTTENSFDSLGRTVKTVRKKAEKQETVLTDWDVRPNGVGLPAERVKGSYRETFDYNPLSRLSFAHFNFNGDIFTYKYTYNQQGKIEKQIYPSGYAVQYSYDDSGYLRFITDATSSKQLVSFDKSDYPGEITDITYGNGVKTKAGFNRLNGRLEKLRTPSHPFVLDTVHDYDQVGNVVKKKLRHLGLREAYTYDKKYQLVTVTNETGVEKVAYDGLGNIKSIENPSFSVTYEYGGDCDEADLSDYQLCRITRREHSNPSTVVKSYRYDQLGGIIDDGQRRIVYGLNGKPVHINSADARVSFEYGPKNQRIRRTDNIGSDISSILYVGNAFEVIEANNRRVLRHYVDGYLQVDMEGDDKKEIYLHRDPLGSVISMTDATGDLIRTQTFTAWGERKDNDDSDNLTPIALESTRGYTNHEMLDSVGLIHMNGRMYDPRARRFISPDPFIQDVNEAIGFNRYAYAWNNPASGADPSGYFFEELERAIGRFGDWISDSHNQRQVIATAAVIVAAVYAPYAVGTISHYAYIASVNYAGAYYASGGNHDASMRSAATTVAFTAVGGMFDNMEVIDSLGAGYGPAKASAHGMIGGISSVASGGEFEHGFLSASISSAASTYGFYESIGATDAPSGIVDYAWNAGAAAIVGGTVSQISGGSFEDGATTAAYGRLFNDLAHVRKSPVFAEPHQVLSCNVDGSYSALEPVEPGIEPDYTVENVIFVARGAAKLTVGTYRYIVGRSVITKKPLLADSYWINKRAPTQVTPGTRTVNIPNKPSSKGGVYQSTTHYDRYGRQIGQTHRTNHGYSNPKGGSYHPNPHHHRRNPITGEKLKDPNTGSRTWPGFFGN